MLSHGCLKKMAVRKQWFSRWSFLLVAFTTQLAFIYILYSNHIVSLRAYQPCSANSSVCSSTCHRPTEEDCLRKGKLFLLNHLPKEREMTFDAFKSNDKLKTILWWNIPYWLATKAMDELHSTLYQCRYSNCRLTTKKNVINESDAVIFSVTNPLIGNQSPPLSPGSRDPNQIWAFFTLEPPGLPNKQFKKEIWRQVFNWSFTYRLQSDIVSPYGDFYIKQNVPERNYEDIVKKKSKGIAWLVSHCQTQSKRMLFVKELQKHIPVDIYGRCGKPAGDDILQTISRDYRFYLGFENSFCKDYATEKLFKYFTLDVINIVRGEFDYDIYVPPETVINTAHFATVKDLAAHLHSLSTNDTKYTEYLRRKDQYGVVHQDFMYKNALCQMCKKLNTLEDNKKTYSNIFEWIEKCREPTDIA